jgi:hypothetical protein
METIFNENYLNGISSDSQIPIYLIQDANKLLRVNDSATGLEWTDEALATGYISERGDGSSNTLTNYVGYIFKNNLQTGLFNYTSGAFNILALRINNLNVLECTPGKINANQNIFFTDDSLLTSQRINFGLGNCGISGDSSTNSQHQIGFRTDNNTRLIINTQDGIIAKTQIQIDPSLAYTLSQPHISQRGTFIMGISFDATYGKIEISSSGTNSLAEFKHDRIDFKEPVMFRNPTCFPSMQIIIDSSYTVPANLSGNALYYMKRGATTNSDITFPQPSAGYNPRYEIITDSNITTPTYNCRLNTLSNDVLFLNASTRTILTGPVVNYTLALNAHFILQFVDADNRWVMIRWT